MKFFWFGDSWVAGDELYKILPEDSYLDFAFPKLVSDYYGAQCINLASNGHSPDILPYHFNKIVSEIDPKVDKIFFFLSADNRTWMFEENGKLGLIANPGFVPQYAHTHHDKWMKFFDNSYQRVYNYDRAVNQLYHWCKFLGVEFYLCNIFTTQEKTIMDASSNDSWLVPKDKCIAEVILPFIDNDTGAVVVNDTPKLKVEQWEIQKEFVKKYIRPLICHPNIQGHKKIAERIIEIFNAKIDNRN